MGQKGKWENRDEKGRGTEKRQGERGRQGRRENNKLGEIERDREAGWESNHTLKADHCQPEEEETCIITAPSRERERGDPGGRGEEPPHQVLFESKRQVLTSCGPQSTPTQTKKIEFLRKKSERDCTVRALPRWSPTRVLDTPMVA